MAYYMRFFVESEPVPTLNDIARAFGQHDKGPRLVDGMLCEGEESFAEISVAARGDDLFDAEVEEFKEFVEDAKGWLGKRRVQQCLSKAKAIVAVQVIFGGRTSEETLSRIDPLWTWLNGNCQGLSQADGEGFYKGRKLILSLD